MINQSAVYILASGRHGTLYIGVTSNLIQRIWQHKHHQVDGFTAKYKVTDLVYFEIVDSIAVAIAREKQLKNWKRRWKINLIEQTNAQWLDLYPKLLAVE
jgi:putative endonuclease